MVAATNGAVHGVLISNYQKEGSEAVTLKLEFTRPGGVCPQLYLLDETHDLELVETFEEIPKQIEVPANSVLLLEL